MENTNGMKGRDTVKSNTGGRGNNNVSSSQQSTTPQNTQTNSTLSTSSSVNTPNVNTPSVNDLTNTNVKTEAVKPTNSPLFVKVTANSYEDNNNNPIATNDPRFGLEANRRWKEQKIAEKNEAQLNKNIDKQQKAISKMTTAITKNPDVSDKQTKGISPEKNLASSALEAGFENKPKKTTTTVTTLPAKSSGEIINKSEIDAQNKRKTEVENAQKEYDEAEKQAKFIKDKRGYYFVPDPDGDGLIASCLKRPEEEVNWKNLIQGTFDKDLRSEVYLASPDTRNLIINAREVPTKENFEKVYRALYNDVNNSSEDEKSALKVETKQRIDDLVDNKGLKRLVDIDNVMGDKERTEENVRQAVKELGYTDKDCNNYIEACNILDKYGFNNEHLNSLYAERVTENGRPVFDENTIQPVYGNSVDSYTDVEGNVYNYNEQQQELRQKVADEFNEINRLYEEGQADIALQLGSELQQTVLNAVSQNAMSQEEASKYFYSIKQIGNEYIQNTYPNGVDTLVEWKQEELVKNDPALQVILQNENFLDAIKEREWQNATQSYVNGEISDNEYSSILNNLAEGGAQEAEKLAMETVGEMTPKKYKSFTELARAKADDVLTQYNVDESQLSYDDYSKLNKIGNTFGFKTFRDVVDTIGNAVKDVSNIALKIADVATLGLLHNKVFKNADKKVSNFFDKVNADTNSNYSQNLKEYATLYGTKEGQTYIQLCRNVKGLSLMGAGFVSFINGDAMTKTAATNMIKTGIGLIMNDVNGDPVERYLDNLAKDFGYDRFKSPNIQTVKPNDTTVSDKQFNSGTTSLDKKKRKTDEEELDSEMNEDTLESWNAGRGYTDEEIQKLIDSNYRNNDVAKNYAGSLRR